MKPIHVSNLEAMVEQWQKRLDVQKDTLATLSPGGKPSADWDWWDVAVTANLGGLNAALNRCIADLRLEIQREQDRQVELETTEVKDAET